jgi:hypothetical protein
MSKSDIPTTTDLILRASIAQVPIALRGTLEDGKFGELSGCAKIDKSLVSLLHDLGADFREEVDNFEGLLGGEVPDIMLESLALGYSNIQPKFVQVAAPVTAGGSSCRFAVLKMIGENSGFVVGLDLHSDGAALKNNFLSGLIGDISIENLGIYYASREFKNVKYDPGETFEDANRILSSKLGDIKIKGRDFTKGLNYAAKILVGDVKLIDVPRPIDEEKPSTNEQETLQFSEAGAGPGATQLSKGSTLWVKTDKSMGPLSVRRIGLNFEALQIGIKLDAALRLSGLTLTFEGLGLSYPINQFTGDPKKIWDHLKIHLDGAAVSFEEGPLTISGGLLKVKDDPLRLDGSLLIRTEVLTISALGSYADLDGTPSFFAFAVLDKDLGGPSFFHVTGLAAGLGVNRTLKLPSIEEVHTFPLIRMAMGNGTPKPQKGGTKYALEKLQDYIQIAGGEYWFAVGVRFSSFEMIQSFALLSVSFGREVVIGLLGMSKMTVPKDADPDKAVAYAELAIRAVIKPEEGTIAVEGRLTDNSYIFSKDCRLTGGFAFYTWFSGPHAGDFVITLGGYHPRFKPQPHYPTVPRLGIHWQVSSQLRVTGELYFALTPSCLMAGGKISAVYETKCIKAWYIAYAHFLLNWKPFYYMIDMGIRIGVEVNLRIPLGFVTIGISIRTELGVGLHLWGPPFAGEIEVDLCVISFTVRFGPAKTPPKPLTANEFLKAFLPPAESEVIAVRITSGLIRQEEVGESRELLRVVNAHALTLTAQSLIPSTVFKELAEKAGNGTGASSKCLGIRPMGKRNLNSTFTVRMSDVTRDRDNLRVSSIETGVPEALWGKSKEEGKTLLPSDPEAETIPATVGIRISFAPKHPQGALPAMAIEKFAYETFKKPIPWEDDLSPAKTIGSGTRSQDGVPAPSVIETVVADHVTQKRNKILDVLAREAPFSLNTVDLTRFAKAQEHYFQADPEICHLGEAFR